MSDLEKVVDKFSGFITREQAEYILENTNHQATKTNFTIKELLSSIDAKRENNTVNIKDKVYRIFNPTGNGSVAKKRIMILGEEGSTMALSLDGKLSESVDINPFERGDNVLVSNAVLDLSSGLKLTSTSNINRITQSKVEPIADYSSIKEELRKVDVAGRVVEISPIRYVNRLGSQGQIAVASCVVTDLANTMNASCWGSSALVTAGLKANDFVKMEFCDVRMWNGKLHIYVNDDSRIFKSNSMAGRLVQNRK
ncbi:MAG: hypothetical protein KGI06_03950 [Candidatus Micrarchaeota archaeon]|nr:hypothetical protein [Candidatus Micrarchaeota archaeon]